MHAVNSYAIDYMTIMCLKILLYEYKDLFIDMDVRKNHSELAIAKIFNFVNQ